MRRTRAIFLSAVTAVAAFGLFGCGNDSAPSASSTTALNATSAVAVPPLSASLPDPAALTGVLYQLADTAVPGGAKLGLVENATADDAAQFDRFGKALQDGGFIPLTFAATDLAWSDSVSGNVVATINVTTPNPATGGFSFPMEFKPYAGSPAGGWQLSQDTADMLLSLGSAEGPTPTAPPR